MEGFQAAIDYFFSFKAYVMLPIVIFVLALIIRMKVINAFVSSLKVGVGFAGVFIIFNFFVSVIGPAVNSIIETRGLDYPILDVGWPPLAAITWASVIAPLSIPLVLVVNMIMLGTNLTKTIDIDVWNYWHFALIGALIQQVTGNFVLAVCATVMIAVITIKLSDWGGPLVERYSHLEGISITTISASGLLPWGVATEKAFSAIPGLNKITYTPAESSEETDSRLSLLSEPMFIGVAIGILFGVLAGYSAKKLLEISIQIAAVMFILPHCAGLIGNGMQAFSLNLKQFITRIFPHKTELYFGMDSGVLMKNKSVLVTGLILMPISILLAFLLPGVRMIPIGDLANLIPVMSMVVIATRSNVFRSVIAGIPVVIGFLYISTSLAPLYTRLSAQTGSTEITYEGYITAFTDGGHHLRFWMLHLFQGNIIAFIVIPAIAFLFFITWRHYKSITSTESISE
jgi:PTS system galactitol-specific IIC component